MSYKKKYFRFACLWAVGTFLVCWLVFPVQAQTPDVDNAQLEEQLTRQFGSAFLPMLREMGKTAGDYVYVVRLVQLAIQKVDAQDYQDARFLLEKAYGIIPSPHVRYWLGRTYQGIGDIVRARREYLNFLDESGRWRLTPVKQDLVEQAKREINRLENALCWLKLHVSQQDAQVYIDGEFAGKTPIQSAIPLKFGNHVLSVIKSGFVRQDIELRLEKPGTIEEREVVLLTQAETVRQSELFRAAEKERMETQRRLEEARRRIKRQEKKRQEMYAFWGRGLLVGAAVSGAWTVASLLLYRHYNQKVEDAPPDTPWKDIADERDKAEFFRVSTYVGLGLTITGVGISTLLTQLRMTQRKRAVSVVPWFSPEAAGVSVTFGF